MPKLTVFFKDKEIDSYAIDEGMVRIGRATTNEVIIESLAVGPVHAVIHAIGGVSTIRQSQDEFPVMLNGIKIRESILNHNDMITLGKHQLLFNSTVSTDQEKSGAAPNPEESSQTAPLFNSESELPRGNLQVMDGEHIGRIMPLKKNLVRLGHPGQAMAVIFRKKQGYFVSALENNGTLTVNDAPIADRIVKLNHNDILIINDKSLQFFLC